MPVMKGLLAPQNTFLDTIATRFDGTRELGRGWVKSPWDRESGCGEIRGEWGAGSPKTVVKKWGAEPLRVEIKTWSAGVGGGEGKVRGCDSRQKRLFVPQDEGGALGATHSRAELSWECV